MTKQVRIPLLFLTWVQFFHAWDAHCQPSYQMTMDSVGPFLDDVMVNESDEMALLLRSKNPVLWPQSTLTSYVLPFNGSANTAIGFEVSFQPSWPEKFSSSRYESDKALFVYEVQGIFPDGLSGVVCMDMSTGTGWAKRQPWQTSDPAEAVFDPSGNVLALFVVNNYISPLYNYPDSMTLGLYTLGPDGTELSKRGFRLIPPPGYGHTLAYQRSIFFDGEGNAYLLGYFTNFGLGDMSTMPYIAKFDSLWNPLVLKTIIPDGKDAFNEMIFTDDGPLILNYAPNNYTFLNNFKYIKDKNAKVIQFDKDLNPIWAKEYFGENYPYSFAGIKVNPNGSGNLLMTHVTFGAFPMVLTELDSGGSILSQRAMPTYLRSTCSVTAPAQRARPQLQFRRQHGRPARDRQNGCTGGHRGLYHLPHLPGCKGLGAEFDTFWCRALRQYSEPH
ncbi:MAG: hypothetical protein R2788_26520 [Saprospiraceae bacterium]